MTQVRRVRIHEVVSEPSTWNPRTSGASQLIRYLDISSINAAEKSVSAVSEILAENAPSRARQIVQSDDVLVSTVRPNLNAVAIVPPDLDGATASTGFAVLRPDPARLDARYLFHWVRSPGFVRQLTTLATGANYPAVTERVVRESRLPLPELAEQRRLTAMLDKADSVLRKQRERMGLLGEFLRSTFMEVFGDPVTNPKRWNVGLLGSLTSKLGSGATPTGGETAYKESGISLIRSLNVRDGVFSSRNLAHIDQQQAAKLSNVVVVENDVLLNITGASVARVCRAPASAIPARVNQHVCIIRPTGALSSHFLEHFLLCAATKRKLLGIAGSGATRQAITKTQLENFLVPIPPVELQQRFADIADRMEALRSKAMHSGWTCEELYRSLALTSFSGNTETLLTL